MRLLMAHHLSRRGKKSFRLALTRAIALLVTVADQKGFFHDRGVRIEYIEVPFARKGMEMLLDGQAEMAVLTEINFAYLGYLKPRLPVKCFVSLERRVADNILIRLENAAPEDLRGMAVGFQPRSTSHSFLMRFLEVHGISRRDLTLKPLSPQAMPAALIPGAAPL